MGMASVTQPAKLQKTETRGTSSAVLDRAKAALELWPSPKIWCLGMTNFTFGFTSGFVNGYVNASFAKPNPTLGAEGIGTLLATTSLVAAVSSTVLSSISQKVGKGAVIGLASLVFACIPLSILGFTPNVKNHYWGPWLVILYILQGIGRGVYESTNKAVFADFYQGNQSAGAFGNCMVQYSFAFFASFILQGLLTDKIMLAWIVVALSSFTMPGFVIAAAIQQREQEPPPEKVS